MILHDFFRSGTSHRLRIALNLKGICYDRRAVSLPNRAHRDAVYLRLNPQGLVPTFENGGAAMVQSPAIIEWLEEVYPDPPLLPVQPAARQRVRAMAALVGCDIHPLNNLRVLTRLRQTYGFDEDAVLAWCATWIESGFSALEELLAREGSERFCHGDSPSLADCYLIPQVFSARRFNVDLAPYPRIRAIDAHCATLEPFINAHPDRQPDAPRP